jgi:hypothetical protein
MPIKKSSLPGAIAGRGFALSRQANLAASSGTTVQPLFYPDSLPYQISPETIADTPTEPETPGTVLGVPPSASGPQAPTFDPLSSYLTQPRTLVFVGAPLDATITPTGAATAPFAEIADAMTYIGAHSDSVFEVDIAPGSYQNFTIPTNKVVILSGKMFTVSAITVNNLATPVFLNVQSFLGTAPTITFAVNVTSNMVLFDSTSARAFGLNQGKIVHGTPICQGAGPYLAFIDAAIPAFYSVIGSQDYIVAVADGQLGSGDVDTLGIVYPAVTDSTVCVLIWPSGTVIPFGTGLVSGTPQAIYRAGNGAPTLSVTTQPIGVDDGRRVFVNIRT